MATNSVSTTNLESAISTGLSITENDLNDLIKIQGDLVRKLKAEKVPAEQIKEAVAKLVSLKQELAAHHLAVNGEEKTTGGDKLLKCPRGTRDYHPGQMKVREEVFRIITDIFKQHGAETIDTPVMELTSLLTEKYGEDSKLIYELKDQGGAEQLALRYDLTVPFARYLAENGISSMKRYHIGKVYRRDNPKMTRGRYREFYQCDFDIAGDFDVMVADAECIKIVVEILDKLDLGQYKIFVNHRKLLDAVFAVCGVPDSHFRPISSAVDKLDKTPWPVVRDEMINEKGLAPEIADKIWSYVQMHGNADLINKLRTDAQLMSQKIATGALNDLETLFRYLSLYDVMDKITFDLKLARGLDYYTGVIFEAVLTNYQYDPQLGEDQVAVGSVAGGGRYDELVHKIDPRQRRVPCIGASIGVERIFAIKEHQMAKSKIQTKTVETEIYVASAQKNLIEERMKLCGYLWANGFKVEMALKRNPKILDQLQYCEKNQVELCVIVGSSELEAGTVKIRVVNTREEFQIPRDQLTEQLRVYLNKVRQQLQESSSKTISN
ncbi:unnamed protein product [Rotaria socialis]|uniref:histidine--tRNA ligase n=2 Tax=Rotaria socialis TaxID=392032 RepID=A0A821DKQ6_9BILA|nr:unnamed protein product [Rotaria socialis]CAF3326705.1 unnamed protein product [Rotaria socialis]CAF3374822.1 unnamed protein product [Rotaria socialis]CAF3617673.1 unnamed protein product [Rotaria socialis]CAF3637801.1 unnamed protein product [Rotaria socialis]